MTRLISEKAAAALESGRNFKQANTRVDGHAQRLYLHENLIAEYINGRLHITLAGWPTLTTCERLNALKGVHIIRSRGKIYLNNQEINDSDWYTID